MGLFLKMKERDRAAWNAGIKIFFALCFMLFLYAPIELYVYNQDEFWFDLYDLLPVILVMCIGGCLLAVLLQGLIYLLFPKWYPVIPVFGSIAFLCSYIQGNFLVDNLPPLDGTQVDWSRYSGERVKSVILWIAVAAFIGIAVRIGKRERFYKAAGLVSACMVLMLTVTLGSVLITTRGYRRKLDAVVTTENQFRMSKDENFIILMLDAVDAECFSGMLGQHPEYRDSLKDFTYYPNTVAAYPYTQRSVPFILSGDWYENDEKFEEYNVNVYKNAPLFTAMEERGYQLNVYELEAPLTDESIFRFDNVTVQENHITSLWGFMKYEIKLVGLRYAPFDLKKYCMFNTIGFLELRSTTADAPVFTSWNNYFYDALLQEGISDADGRQFKFIHLEGAHVPYRYDEDLNIVQEGSYEDNIKACMTLTDTYLDMLREADVYDNSVIIIMADHGYALEERESIGRQSPLLMVKGIGELHEFQVSEAPISHADLQQAYMRLLDGKSSTEIFDAEEGNARERRYLYYTYDEEERMIEYLQTGYAWDEETMKATGREYLSVY